MNHWISPQLADVIGFAGTACILFAYAYITWAERPTAYVQHGTNLVGALLLTASLTVHFNAASLLLEAFWSAIAIWGLVKALRAQRN